MMARPPVPRRTNAAAASTFGLMPPSSSAPPAISASASADAHPADGPRGRRAPPFEHGVHVGEDHQHLRPELRREDGRDPILVHHGVDALEAQHRILVHRGPAPARRDARWYPAPAAAAPPASSTMPSGRGLVAIRRQSPAPSRPTARPASRSRADLGLGQRVPDRLGGPAERRIVPVHQRLGHHRRPRRAAPGAAVSAFCSDCCSM